jgi:arginase
VNDRVAILGVPSSAGSHYAGQEKAPAALRRAGLIRELQARRIAAVDVGDLPLHIYQPRSSDRRAQNLREVVRVGKEVADRVDELVREGFFPLVIGGDCTITLGVLAGLRRHIPRLGLMYFDGDVDLNVPETSPTGVLDSMGIAHALGRGASELNQIGDELPLLDEDRIVLFGHDPSEVTAANADELRQSRIALYPAPKVTPRSKEVAHDAVEGLETQCDQFLLHFDVDVIDSSDCPLANFPHHREGLSLSDAFACLGTFLSSPKVGGLVITELNPDHDGDGTLVPEFLSLLVESFAASGKRFSSPT